ncbi:MAG: hypothetical protein J6T74_01145 [Clostridia bacterium]|nr:hypothetical protein [Clostridia bacterium]
MNNEEFFVQFVVAYKKNGKWYRDSERHQYLKTVSKRLNELKNKGKYEDYKICYRKISKWIDLGDNNE